MTKLSKMIREYVKCPQLGSSDYGIWGLALNTQERMLLCRLCDECDTFEEAAYRFCKENEQLKKEIEELKESNGVTKELYKNYYTQLQNYRSKLYNIDIPKLRKKHLTPEEKEIYYKGFENCERQFASHIADITIKLRHEICEKIREKCVYVEGTKRLCENTSISTHNLNEILDQIERGE